MTAAVSTIPVTSVVPAPKPPTDSPAPARDERPLKDRYADVCGRIAVAAKKAGQRPDDVILVAVTKHAEPDQVRELIQLGHRDFAENRVQQLVIRASMVEEYLSRRRVAPHAAKQGTDAGSVRLGGAAPRGAAGAAADREVVRWHMIGHLQRNKVRKAVEFSRLIHSVDSLRLAEEIQEIATRRDQPVEVLVQVNCSGERSKFGCPVPAAVHLAEQIDTMIHVRVRGLMTMAPYSSNPEDARLTFARCRELFDEIQRRGVGADNPPSAAFNLLSMGMSGDYEVAVSEGANIVRVGSAIFGEPRNPTPDEEDED